MLPAEMALPCLVALPGDGLAMPYDDALTASADSLVEGIAARQALLREQTEDVLRARTLDFEPRRETAWHRDYSSEEAFLRSVEPNRERWRRALGDFGPATGRLHVRVAPFLEDDDMVARWVSIRVLDGFDGHAILALPRRREGAVPLVICQHGIGSSPERCFGFADDPPLYHAFARRLVAAEGYAVLAPQNITEAAPRARVHRLALMLGGTLWGLEMLRLQRLIDFVCTVPEVDAERIAMWGISLGGAYALMATPLEPRIKVAIVTAWFNDRLRKMAVDDERYSCFLSVDEEHVFIPGWLTEFLDSDLASLICPRPLMVQTGKEDGIAWWPFVVEEFRIAWEHYWHLNVEERAVIDLHEGGHEIRYEAGRDFLVQWL
jgi:dienelactone hydrolase